MMVLQTIGSIISRWLQLKSRTARLSLSSYSGFVLAHWNLAQLALKQWCAASPACSLCSPRPSPVRSHHSRTWCTTICILGVIESRSRLDRSLRQREKFVMSVWNVSDKTLPKEESTTLLNALRASTNGRTSIGAADSRASVFFKSFAQSLPLYCLFCGWRETWQLSAQAWPPGHTLSIAWGGGEGICQVIWLIYTNQMIYNIL